MCPCTNTPSSHCLSPVFPASLSPLSRHRQKFNITPSVRDRSPARDVLEHGIVESEAEVEDSSESLENAERASLFDIGQWSGAETAEFFKLIGEHEAGAVLTRLSCAAM